MLTLRHFGLGAFLKWPHRFSLTWALLKKAHLTEGTLPRNFKLFHILAVKFSVLQELRPSKTELAGEGAVVRFHRGLYWGLPEPALPHNVHGQKDHKCPKEKWQYLWRHQST